jgi:hypothetical protein
VGVSDLDEPTPVSDADGGSAVQTLTPGEPTMAQRDYTPHQQKIIKRYYNNLDTLSLQRLAELVGELYLTTGKKRQGVWTRVVAAMQKLGVPQSRIDHLRAQDNPALVAQVVKELEGK